MLYTRMYKNNTKEWYTLRESYISSICLNKSLYSPNQSAQILCYEKFIY